ncbi:MULTISPECIES: tRNA nucleotidyltransferase [Acidithiobacillus]|jgi:tRNA nucleotidyltransferase (CCA-adding enzyme)|uniref:tRNA nucleotidyltransferase n=4 Tax=Acidithiobacillus caldus TaxID=33059 RepID=F9ZMD9_ACICS|nr:MULTISPECIES: tRNA nucleotidyltransferase [Acidithiobacillus]AEK57288.1 tRNA nucleotidyltransferase [Acidithiobacillus caldus SM-1]AIA54548.1 tRNA nucleotidyltransferase [Acidithiobacillus caldus ATCC 51756]AUW32043.1 tRNA nucleotidyltransferase [Acidithiobacillus caldus]MBU2728380.1 tRNA nucleotidyltransferase [Acidithiobacillus caldus]MBU2735792.1 tRNA nucleotidyltransferase [Acidithiobacillus caldus ATCC 51756]
MKRYLVGGAVRDRLRGVTVQDRDYVLVGAGQEDIDALLARGFRWAGKDFPVLIGREGEEYALARTERKTGSGHRGFVVATAGVSLEDDLLRRDLTINAMAEDLETGAIVDPYGGRRDLDARVLRHVSPAFREDPLRVLRLARFAARLPDFVIAPETEALVRQMIAAGELAELSPDRVWKETEKALKGPAASRYFSLLWYWSGLAVLFPELLPLAQSGLPWQRGLAALDHCLHRYGQPALAWAAFCYPMSSRYPAAGEGALMAMGRRLPIPKSWQRLTLAAVTGRTQLLPALRQASPRPWLRLLLQMGALRDGGVLGSVLQVWQAIAEVELVAEREWALALATTREAQQQLLALPQSSAYQRLGEAYAGRDFGRALRILQWRTLAAMQRQYRQQLASYGAARHLPPSP